MRRILVAIRFLVATWRAAVNTHRVAVLNALRLFGYQVLGSDVARRVAVHTYCVAVLHAPLCGENLQEDSRREGIYLFFKPPTTPNQPPTKAVPSPYQGRCILGFRFKTKSEDAAALVAGWYGAGTALV